LIALAAVLGVAVYRAPDADWNLTLPASCWSSASRRPVANRGAGHRISASFLAIVLAAVFSGVTPP
jgi:hypothetical protein